MATVKPPEHKKNKKECKMHFTSSPAALGVRATPKSNSVDNVQALQGDATVLEKVIKL